MRRGDCVRFSDAALVRLELRRDTVSGQARGEVLSVWQQSCEGRTARWCPNCGTCTAEYTGEGYRECPRDCPLHGWDSQHPHEVLVASVRWSAECEAIHPVEALEKALRTTFSNPPRLEAK